MMSPTLLLMRMNAADTRASSAIADCTPLAVVSRSFTTAEIETFINDVSTTSTNIAIARSTASSGLPDVRSGTRSPGSVVTVPPTSARDGSDGYDGTHRTTARGSRVEHKVLGPHPA